VSVLQTLFFREISIFDRWQVGLKSFWHNLPVLNGDSGKLGAKPKIEAR
jgi:hypothetical protein